MGKKKTVRARDVRKLFKGKNNITLRAFSDFIFYSSRMSVQVEVTSEETRVNRASSGPSPEEIERDLHLAVELLYAEWSGTEGLMNRPEITDLLYRHAYIDEEALERYGPQKPTEPA